MIDDLLDPPDAGARCAGRVENLVARLQSTAIAEALVIIDTGQNHAERIAAPGRYYASPVAANGNIYLTALDDGTVTVLKAGSERPTPRWSNKMTS